MLSFDREFCFSLFGVGFVWVELNVMFGKGFFFGGELMLEVFLCVLIIWKLFVCFVEVLSELLC